MFRATGIGVQFEGVKALTGVDIDVRPAAVIGLIGPNGAGKTTLVNVLSGFQEPAEGRVLDGEHDVTGMSPERLARSGISRTFQGSRSFGDLTAFENVEVSAVGVGVGRREARERAAEVLAAVGIASLADDRAADLTTNRSAGSRWRG